jgi:hypothetical protein
VSAAVLYSQATGETVVANVHVAPGLGNALGSLYGALKSSTPLIMTAGQQDTRMRLRDPVLGHDLVAMAAPVVKWSTQVNSADEMAAVMQRATNIANEAPKGPDFVALPINVMERTSNGAWSTSAFMPKPARPSAYRGGGDDPGRGRPVIMPATICARRYVGAGASPGGWARPCRIRCASTWSSNRHAAYGGTAPGRADPLLSARPMRAVVGDRSSRSLA